MTPAAFLIQGIFFQNREWLDVAYKPIEGMVPVIARGLCRFIYAGTIWEDPNHVLGGLTGSMQDHFGESRLTDIYIDGGTVRFIKRYNHRDFGIQYKFEKKDGETWVGEYYHPQVGAGISRCLLIPVEESFFTPESILKILGKPTAHTWKV